MALKASMGLRNHALAVGSVKNAIDGKIIDIYSGTVPATADDAVSGDAVLLCVISESSTGTGITWESPATDGVLLKTPAETWSGVNLASGVATWFRITADADAGDASTTEIRIQGTVAQSGGDMNISNTSLTVDATQTITSGALALPTF